MLSSSLSNMCMIIDVARDMFVVFLQMATPQQIHILDN